MRMIRAPAGAPVDRRQLAFLNSVEDFPNVCKEIFNTSMYIII